MAGVCGVGSGWWIVFSVTATGASGNDADFANEFDGTFVVESRLEIQKNVNKYNHANLLEMAE